MKLTLKTTLRTILIFVLLPLPLLFGIAARPSAQAQETNTCPAVVEQALTAVSANCAALGRNSACYGYNSVGATFLEEVSPDFFTLPADLADLNIIESIQTTPLNLTDNAWGIALLNVQANLPNTLPGQGVVFLLLGDASLTNAVPAAAAFTPVAPVMLTVNANANVRSAPTTRSNVLFTVANGSSAAADGRNAAGDWLRITTGERVGWIFSELVTGADTTTLPVIDENTIGAMQAFYFTTGIGESLCAEAPDVLLIQGPKDITVDLTANEARVSISSTILLELLDEETMQITVVDGEAQINNLIVPQGFKATAPLDFDPDDDSTPEGTPQLQFSGLPRIAGTWQSCQPLDDDDRARISSLINLPPDLLNYPIVPPPNVAAICAPPGAAQPTVVPQPNNPDATAESTSGVQQPPAGGVDCSAFVGTFPTGGSVPFGTVQFFWDGAAGATRYRVVINSDTGGVVGILETGDASTGITADSSGWSGNNFTWEVQALDGSGNTICTTPRLTFTRDGAPPPPTEDPNVRDGGDDDGDDDD